MGSSPRARGARFQLQQRCSLRGIIPACAGSTPGTPICWGGRGGSSPRARGAPLPGCGRALAAGIIPACAGSTCTAVSTKVGGRDHPRVRGEHVAAADEQLPVRGSSPRARGALVELELNVEDAGIIPACAGSTRLGPARLSPVRDHPRVRGEHMLSAMPSPSITGSSPRARGALSATCAFMSRGRGF